jgi:hypothetical protein
MRQQHSSVRLPIVQTQNAPSGACCLCLTSPVASGHDSSQGFLQMMPLLTLFVPSSSYLRRWDASSSGNIYSLYRVFLKSVMKKGLFTYGISGIVEYGRYVAVSHKYYREIWFCLKHYDSIQCEKDNLPIAFQFLKGKQIVIIQKF